MFRAEPRQLALEHLAPLAAVLAHVLALEPGPHLGAAARRGEIAFPLDEPVARRLRLLAADDLDHLAIGEAMVERHDAAVDARPAASMAEIRVHVIREVERRRTGRQVDDLALGRQRVHPVVEEVRAHAAQEVGVGLGLRDGREQLPQPFDLAVVGGVARGAFLVPPVRGDTQLGVIVHLARADLDLDRHGRRPEHRRVQRSVQVVLRRRDVVVELAGDVVPAAVHHAERGVAMLDRPGDDAHGAHVEHLLECEVLAMHLPPDAVDVLRAAHHLGRDAGARELARNLRDERIDVALAVDARLVEPSGNAAVLGRLEPAERQVLELPFQLPDSEPVRERRIDLARLPREVQPGGVVEIARVPHAAQLVREAHENQARVGDDGEQHPAERVRLAARQAAAGRRQGPRANLAETPEPFREDRRNLAHARDRLGAREVAARKERLDQGAGNDVALGVECGDDRRGFLALGPRLRPAVRRRRPVLERGAQWLQHGRAGGRSRGRRLHGEWLS